MLFKVRWFFTLILLVLSLTACPPSNVNPPPNTIGPSGGTITSSDGHAKAVIPAGALSESITLTLSKVNVASLASLPEELAGSNQSDALIYELKSSKATNLNNEISIELDPVALGLDVAGLSTSQTQTRPLYVQVNDSWQSLFSYSLVGDIFRIKMQCVFCKFFFFNPSITVSPSNASIAVGASQQFSAVARDGWLINKPKVEGMPLTWVSTSNVSVASINNNGLATALGIGTTTITASTNGVTSNSASLTVTQGFNAPNRSLYVPDFLANLVRIYSPSQLASSTTAAAQKILTLPSGSGPNSLAFDNQGNLWVVARNSNKLLMYSKSQLSALVNGNNSPSPSRTLNGNGMTLERGIGIIFDSAGNAWISQENNRVVKLTPAMLSGSTALTNQASITGNVPAGLAFDGAGLLWVTMAGENSLEAYDISSATPQRRIKLQGGNTGLVFPEGVAFHSQGTANCQGVIFGWLIIVPHLDSLLSG
ncbi:MAG: Ig-like domain-containing protein [Deinococcales bacterium]